MEDQQMKISENKTPRKFLVGHGPMVEISDCGTVQLSANEQVTFLTANNLEYDVVRKEWGYYATPSLNGRLADNDLRAVLTKNQSGNFYVLLVERGRESAFHCYLEEEDMSIVAWIDSGEMLSTLEYAVQTVMGE